jgi:hypothetical protein
MQMGIGRAGFYAHHWVERLMSRAWYVEGRHSATRIHPQLPPLNVGDTVPMVDRARPVPCSRCSGRRGGGRAAGRGPG